MTDRDPESGRFKKGISGNPGGRPKGLSISALIDQAVSEADWLYIFKLLLRKAKAGNFKAIEMLLDRRFGKAMQPTELGNKDGEAFNLIIRKAGDEGHES